MPQHGDVIILLRSTSPPTYVLNSPAGPGQISCGTQSEAVYMATSYAAKLRVDAWESADGQTFTLLTSYRPAGVGNAPSPSSAVSSATAASRDTPPE